MFFRTIRPRISKITSAHGGRILHASAAHVPKFRSIVGLAVLFSLLVVCCKTLENGDARVRRLTRPMMGTLVEVVWRAKKGAPDLFAEAREVADRMEGLADRMSLYSNESEVARINREAGRRPVKVSEEVFEVIEKSLEVSRLTRGAFDVTVGPVETVWGDIQSSEGEGRLPDVAEIREALADVGYRGIRLNQKEHTVFLEKKGARLDLGGIAKGYIVDQGMRWLKGQGNRDVMINAGGDIRATAEKGGTAWKVGLQDPFERSRLLGVFRIRQGAVVTSGTYERYRDTEQGRVSHILDPGTGMPVKDLVSVTVLAHEAAFADALATALMVMGRKKGLALLKRLHAVKGVFIEEDGTFWVEEGLKEIFELEPLAGQYTLRFYGFNEVPSDSGSPSEPPEVR